MSYWTCSNYVLTVVHVFFCVVVVVVVVVIDGAVLDVYVVAFIAIFTLPCSQRFTACFVNLFHHEQRSCGGISAQIRLKTKEA